MGLNTCSAACVLTRLNLDVRSPSYTNRAQVLFLDFLIGLREAALLHFVNHLLEEVHCLLLFVVEL